MLVLSRDAGQPSGLSSQSIVYSMHSLLHFNGLGLTVETLKLFVGATLMMFLLGAIFAFTLVYQLT